MLKKESNSLKAIPFSGIQSNKQTKTSLNERVEELRRMATVVSDSNDAVILHDPKGKILAWNRGAKETYGYSEAEALGKNVRDIVAEPDRQAALTLISKIMHGEIVKSFELRRVTKDGRILDVWLTTTLLRDEKGNPVAIATTERDITERKCAERELIAAKEKAEESDRLKSAFLANMSHEIRTPLNSIIGFSDLLLDPFFEKEQYGTFARIIRENGNNLLTIINDILEISKIEAGQIQINKQLLSVNQLISNIQKEYSFKAKEKGIELKLDLSNPDELWIESDVSKLREVLINLIGNAIKFTQKGFIELGYIKSGDFVQFHVKDSGIGIAEEFHQQVFERFRQVESAFTRKYSGNGLGLPICKSLVELLGGSIWMESTQGTGSTFYFTIPIKIAN
ncbi:MAG TPA: ATP-binding protein [Prolixibacteraceae bacterium]|jgi:PAS domain S-box-containing protein